MYDVVGYHRPTTLSDALQFLAGDDRVALAGGVHLRHDGAGRGVDLVDLQSVGLDRIDVGVAGLTIGATVRLQTLVDDPSVPEAVTEAARAEQPSTLRTLATVGGTIATAPDDSLLLAAFLVHDGVVRLASHDRGERSTGLAELLAAERDHHDLIIAITIEPHGNVAIAATGRTPRDRPIVGVVGRVDVAGSARIAVCGLGPVPAIVDPDAIASLPSFDDHRATASYRRHLAEVLTARVLEDLR